MEKTYNELGALVKQLDNQNIMVAKIDCTKYTSMATHFGIRGFPTIMFIDSTRKVEFLGERNKDEMLEFVKRLSGPAVKKLSNCNELENVKKQHNVFFINFDDQPNLTFAEMADQFLSTDWFFHLDKKCPNYDYNSIYSVKTSLRNNVITKKYEQNTNSLNDWIKLERFPNFLRIGLSNLHYLLGSTNKLLAIVLIKESKVGRFSTNKEREYYEILEQQANSYAHKDQFIFGWTNQLDIINSIAIQTIDPIPNFIFINASTMTYYLYDQEVNEKRLVEVLDSFANNDPILIAQGGNSYWNKLKRLGYDGFVTVSLMFESNPILTIILFGLPITFFSIIIYCSCCSDMLDGKDFEDDEESGEENYELLDGEQNNQNEQNDENEENEEIYDEQEDDEEEQICELNEEEMEDEDYSSVENKSDHLKSE